MRDWDKDRRALIHKLNGHLLEALQQRLWMDIRWNPQHWVVNVIILRRNIEEKEEAFLKTSATMLNGKIYDEEKELDPEMGMGDFDRIVPLINSLSGYCVRTGNVVWVDNLEDLTKDKTHPLYRDYRPFQYVSVKPERDPLAEYVFPIRIQIGLSEAILGVLNAECTSPENQFKEQGFHKVLDPVINLLDVHGPFLVAAERVKFIGSDEESDCKVNSEVKSSLLNAHSRALEATMLSRHKEDLSNEN